MAQGTERSRPPAVTTAPCPRPRMARKLPNVRSETRYVPNLKLAPLSAAVMPSTTIRMAKAGETNRKVCAFLVIQPADGPLFAPTPAVSWWAVGPEPRDFAARGLQ